MAKTERIEFRVEKDFKAAAEKAAKEDGGRTPTNFYENAIQKAIDEVNSRKIKAVRKKIK